MPPVVDGNIKNPKHGKTVVVLINQKSTLKEFQIRGAVAAITLEMRR